MRRTGLPLLAAVLLAAGCASHSSEPAVRQATQPNLLSGCGPLSEQHIAGALHAGAVRPQTAPTICTWKTAYTNGGTADVTYAYLIHDTLGRDVELATARGYQVEKTVLERFGAMTWRDPRDPGSCAVTAADSGTVTWWVQNRDHAAAPDPCAGALNLMNATLTADGI